MRASQPLKQFFFVLVLAICIAASAAGQPSPQHAALFAYNIKVDEAHNQRLSVQIVAERPASSRLSFSIPAWTPGYYQILHFEKSIEHVHAEDEAGHALSVAHPLSRQWGVTFRLASSHRVTFSYDVKANDKGFGFFGSSVDIRHRLGYINGASALMYVSGAEQAPVSLTVILPSAWKCVTPLQNENGTYHAANYDDLIDCPLQFGLFDSFDFQVNAIPFTCVLVGDHQADTAELTDKLSRIAKSAVAVFGSTPFQRYVFFYHIGDEGFIGGLEHHNSMVIHLDDPIKDGDDDDFLTTTAHELFHAWNVKQIRPEGLGPFDYTVPVRTPSLWFCEGVTDYYADLLPVRAGLRTHDWYLEQLTEHIHQLDVNPSRLRVTAEAASRKAWEGQSEGFGGLSYYLKGSLIGCWFDLRIRELSHGARSLDDVMRELERRYGERNRPFPESALLSALNSVAGVDLTDEYNGYVRGLQDFHWEELFHGVGWELRRQKDGYLGASFLPDAPFDDFDDSDDSERPAIVQRAEAGFPAEKMGLHPGDRILTVNGREVKYGMAGLIVRSLPASASVCIAVLRNGKIIELKGEVATQFSHHKLSILPPNLQTEESRRLQYDLFAPNPIQKSAVTDVQ